MSDASPPLPVASPPSRAALRVARATWIALLVLAILWEWLLAPLRPGGSWLILKAAPLALLARNVWQGDAKALQWALLAVTLYLAEGVVRLAEPLPARALAALELLLAGAFYAAAIVHLRPLKKAARLRERSR
ncbi:MAG: DUF2069 domain-containing protein [Burkholderiaceae bacterium]|nr:DUF2069 domain-containing protein [Burkholderiaceae bacterium]MCX8005846.1 DUF2069 domain-containing protein [Burkholderiaceae bacterium]